MPPSSEEGKVEGLAHAAAVSSMQCTSNPVCIRLLSLLEAVLKDKSLDKKISIASNYVLMARRRMVDRTLPADIGANERFFTGTMANAINSVIGNGFTALHQSCLGKGTTHSDLSACRIHDLNRWPTTRMVGEGKWNAGDLRRETRGQIFNQLLRHRAVDASKDYSPILLLAFDNKKVEIDLAFPSTKGGKLAKDEVIKFSSVLSDNGDDTETFWTVQLLRMSIEDAAGKKNLPIILRFIAESLEELDNLPEVSRSRVQHKMPLLESGAESSSLVEHAEAHGDNVTILSSTDGTTKVYKEYCYHLREPNLRFKPCIEIDRENQRQPPPDELLRALGHPYTEWCVDRGPCGVSVLRYDFIEGSSQNPFFDGWLMILGQVQAMHKAGFVHGDLLPRNVLFCEPDRGYVIDFDLSRKEDGKYVWGFNYEDFQEFRHPCDPCAKQTMKMKKKHDTFSLFQMSKHFFNLGHTSIMPRSIDDIITLFADSNVIWADCPADSGDTATSSPDRSDL